jgi:hypothetical protein
MSSGRTSDTTETSPRAYLKITYSNVRHEALLWRMEVRDLRCSAVVAVG